MPENFLTLKLCYVADFDPLQKFNVILVVCLILALIVFPETKLFLFHYPFAPTIVDLYNHKIRAKQKQEEIYSAAVNKEPSLASQPKVKIDTLLFGNGEEPKPGSPGDIQVKKIENAIKEIFEDVRLKPFWAKYGSPDDIRAVIVPGWLMNEGNFKQWGITLNAWRINSSSLGPPDGRLFLPDAVTIHDTHEHKDLMTSDGRARIAINLQAFEKDSRLKLTLLHEFLHVLGLPAYKPIFCILELQSDLAYEYDYPLAIKAGDIHFWKEDYREWIIWLLISIFCVGMIAARARSRNMTTFELLKEKGKIIRTKIKGFPKIFK
jgi:hypothetical protein